MSVTVKLHSVLQKYADGQEVVEVKGKTVGECFNYMVRKYPELKKHLYYKRGKLFGYFDVYVNGMGIYPENLKKQVNDGDEITINIYIAGG
jgi:molybdopterin converting factor small subunit